MINLKTSSPLVTDRDDLVTLNLALRGIYNNFSNIADKIGGGVGVEQFDGIRYESKKTASLVYHEEPTFMAQPIDKYLYSAKFQIGHGFGQVPSGYLPLKLTSNVGSGNVYSCNWYLRYEDTNTSIIDVQLEITSATPPDISVVFFVMR